MPQHPDKITSQDTQLEITPNREEGVELPDMSSPSERSQSEQQEIGRVDVISTEGLREDLNTRIEKINKLTGKSFSLL